MTKKERKGEGNMSIGPRMKYGHARHIGLPLLFSAKCKKILPRHFYVCVCEQMSLNRCDNLEEFVVDISPLRAGLNSTVLNCVLNYYNLH